MVIQIHQKTGDLGEGSTHTTCDCNEEMEEDKEEENVQAPEPELIIRDIEQNFQYVISYAKAWRAKQKVFEMRFGTYEASYDNLPRMLEAMCTEILKVLLIHTVYRACQGGQAFCCELSSALEHCLLYTSDAADD